MGWLFVPGLKESVSDSQSWNPHIVRSVTWRGKHTRPEYWQRVWSKAPWIRVLSGMISNRLTADDGVESWILSMRDSRANRIPSPENAKESPTSVTSGPLFSESSKRLEPPWSSSKMCQGSFSGFDLSERNYADWVTGLRLEYSARANAVPATGESGCSFWPTADASVSTGYNQSPSPNAAIRPTLGMISRNWPSPNAHDGRRPGVDERSTQGGNLNRDAALWPTPDTRMNRGSRESWMAENPKAGRDLTTETEMWGTPTSRDHKDGATTLENTPVNGLLGRQAILFSPRDRETAPGDPSLMDGQISPRRWMTPRSKEDGNYQYDRSAPEGKRLTLTGQTRSAKKKLNPNFVDWMMGFPVGWTSVLTDFAPAEMQSYLSKQRWLLSRLLERRP